MQLRLNGSSKQLYSSQFVLFATNVGTYQKCMLVLCMQEELAICCTYLLWTARHWKNSMSWCRESLELGWRIAAVSTERVIFFQCLAMSISTTSIHFNPLQFLHKFAHVAGIKKLIHPVLWSLKHFETCGNSLRPDRVCYGPKQVFEAIEKCAVQTLMVSGPDRARVQGTPKWDGPSG